MEKENQMPALPLHLIGLAVSGLLVWGCFVVWEMMPRYVGPTWLGPLRIVCALLAMIVLLSVTQFVLVKLKTMLAWFSKSGKS